MQLVKTAAAEPEPPCVPDTNQLRPAHAFTASPIPKRLCFTLQSFGSVLGRSLAAHDFQIILDSEEWIKKKKGHQITGFV